MYLLLGLVSHIEIGEQIAVSDRLKLSSKTSYYDVGKETKILNVGQSCWKQPHLCCLCRMLV